MQASQFDNYWWVMHLDSQKTFEAETTTKNPQQKVSDINILCVSLNPSGFPFFFFRFQLDTKWTYVDSVDLFFSTSQAQKWTVRWFFVCWHFSFPPFFFWNENIGRLATQNGGLTLCGSENNKFACAHLYPVLRSWIFKEKDDFLRVCG